MTEKERNLIDPLLPPHLDERKENNGNKDIVEIPAPLPSGATNVIPDEVPRRDGPGGE